MRQSVSVPGVDMIMPDAVQCPDTAHATLRPGDLTSAVTQLSTLGTSLPHLHKPDTGQGGHQEIDDVGAVPETIQIG